MPPLPAVPNCAARWSIQAVTNDGPDGDRGVERVVPGHERAAGADAVPRVGLAPEDPARRRALRLGLRAVLRAPRSPTTSARLFGVQPMSGTVRIGSPPAARVSARNRSAAEPKGSALGVGVVLRDVHEEPVHPLVRRVVLPVVAGHRVPAPAPHGPLQLRGLRRRPEVHAEDLRVHRPPVERRVDRDRHRPADRRRGRRPRARQEPDVVDVDRRLVPPGGILEPEPVPAPGRKARAPRTAPSPSPSSRRESSPLRRSPRARPTRRGSRRSGSPP